MNKLIRFALLIALTVCFAGCKTQSSDYTDETPVVNPYVEAFTSGMVSRMAPVEIHFTEEIPTEKLRQEEIQKRIKIKPKIEGEFSFESNSVIAFRPTQYMSRNTNYQVSVDLSDWFPVSSKDKMFDFSFTTYPFRIETRLESMDMNTSGAGTYDLTFELQTLDVEDNDIIESVIETSEKISDKSWSHSLNGKVHTLKLRNVEPSGDKRRTLDLSVAKNKHNIPAEKLITIAIPTLQEFSVYEVEMNSDPENYIEVTFTQPLDTKQDLRGLVYLQRGNSTSSSGNQISSTTEIDGNRLKVYSTTDYSGDFSIFINEGIKSAGGAKLGETVVRSFSITENLPDLELIGKGVIIPNSDQLIIPFRAVYLRGVVVRVIRIMESNVGQFLQLNQLDGKQQLKRVGRLMTRKTIFLDETGKNPGSWNTYAIDLRQLIDPEPGAIYRVELSFNRELSAYPCGDDENIKSKEQILAEEEATFKKEVSSYDEVDNYYYYWDYDYDYYRDNDSDPCRDSYYRNRSVSRNVLATNLGIIAKRNPDNEMMVLVHNLVTTEPERWVEVTVHNYQNEIIGRGTTDNDGQTRITLRPGKPFYIIAASGKQRSYLRVDDGSSLSLSNFDVAGEVIQKGIKGFIYGDRGVWRPGDTMYLSFMLNDKDNTLPEGHPVVMELYQPSGQLYLRKTQTKGEMGLYAFEMPTEYDVPTGSWNVEVKVGGVTFSKRLRVETVKPNRLKIALTHDRKVVMKNHTLNTDMHVEWLQGATARNLKYEIEGTFTSTTTQFSNYVNYQFDDMRKKFTTEEVDIASGNVDGEGNAKIESSFDLGSKAPGMLMASLLTRVYEDSGDFSVDGDQILYSPYGVYVGIRSPQTKDMIQLDTGKDYEYEIVTVDYEGKPSPDREIEVKLYRHSWYWWFGSNNDNQANYTFDSHQEPMKTFTVKTGANGKGKFKINIDQDDWGVYYIAVTEKMSRHSSGVMNYYDWPGWSGRRDTERGTSANVLNFKTNKDSYEIGENIVLTVPSAEGSRAIVSIENGSKVLSVTHHPGNAGETVIEIPATAEMQPNVFVHVTLLQRHGNAKNDAPIRMYGIVPVNVNTVRSKLNPEIKVADEIKPEQKYNVTVSEKDGREMAYTLAIVDEGLLDLTRFKTPQPWNTFNAKEALGITSWDIYNYIVGAYGGRIEQIFSIGGDDGLNSGKKAIVNRFIPVVEFAGPFYLKKGEKKQHTFDMPNYNGRVRVMLVAGDGKAYGNTEKSVFVRKPVMMLGTLPRIIGVGEEMDIPATVFATEENIGKVSVSIECSNNMEIVGSKSKDLQFKTIEDKQATFRIRVKNKPGAGKVKLTATGKGDKAVYETEIEIRTVERPQVKVISALLDGGKTWKQTVAMPGIDGTNKLTLEVSDIPPINLSKHVDYLIGYPHGCLEQITSKGFPQIYLKHFANLTLEQQQITDGAVKEVIRRLRSYQRPSGGFSYWPGGNSSADWAGIYATHFMLEAEAKGFLVPDNVKKGALSELKKEARNWRGSNGNTSRSDEMVQAYRLYVLALGQQTEIGAMNRLREKVNLSPMARWQLAGAYVLAGREDVANSLIEIKVTDSETYDRYDYTYGSNLRDKAIRLQTLCLLKKGPEAFKLVKEISEQLASSSPYSTQTTAYCLMALSTYINRYSANETMEFSYDCKTSKEKVDTDKSVWSKTVITNGGTSTPVEIKNTGKSTLFVQVISEGIPEQGTEQAYSNDVAIKVRYTDLKGSTLDVTKLEQGTNFRVVVNVENQTTNVLKNLALTQIFPAGWEILNTRYMNEEETRSATTNAVNYQDFRDDRVYSYIDELTVGRSVSIQINLCAVYPGKFYLPPVWCEAMYDHLIRANTEGSHVVVE